MLRKNAYLPLTWRQVLDGRHVEGIMMVFSLSTTLLCANTERSLALEDNIVILNRSSAVLGKMARLDKLIGKTPR